MAKKSIIIASVVIILLGSGWLLVKPLINQRTPHQIDATQADSNDSVQPISPRELATLVKTSQVFLLDVHTPEQTHIPETTAFIPYDQIQSNLNQLPEDKSTPIVVYCRSGTMSARAAKEIAALGYTKVYDLTGGTNAYKEQQVSVSLWPSKHELGTVIYGDVATTNYTLTNYTPLPVKITRVSTSCGCTKATAERTELAAYETTTVNVTFDPAVHKDDTDLGDLTRTIYIETDNPNFPELESTFSATVVKP